MTDYETRRLENIKRNQALINELGIQKVKQETSSKRPPPKKRKLSPSALRPTRVSARIASTDRPIYNDGPSTTSDTPKSARRGGVKSVQSVTADAVEIKAQSPPPDLEDIRRGWTSWESIAPPPTRDEDGTFHFEGHPTFLPNKSPAEMLAEGAFGGSYYRPLYSKSLRTTIQDDWKELPEEWLKDLNVERYLTSPDYDPEINKFRVKCGK